MHFPDQLNWVSWGFLILFFVLNYPGSRRMMEIEVEKGEIRLLISVIVICLGVVLILTWFFVSLYVRKNASAFPVAHNRVQWFSFVATTVGVIASLVYMYRQRLRKKKAA
jgi:heme/copper-type cytochrome/quinol oxidase subunit 2